MQKASGLRYSSLHDVKSILKVSNVTFRLVQPFLENVHPHPNIRTHCEVSETIFKRLRCAICIEFAVKTKCKYEIYCADSESERFDDIPAEPVDEKYHIAEGENMYCSDSHCNPFPES